MSEIRQSLQRVRATAFASALGQLLVVGNQLIVLPISLYFWGQARYGEWLVLSAMPVFLNWTEFGIGTAAANRVCLDLAIGDIKQAQRVMTASVSIFLYGCLSIAGIWILTVPIITSIVATRFHVLSASDITWSLRFLGPYALLGMMQWPLLSVFRANGVNHVGVMVSNGSRLADIVVGVVVVMTSRNVVCLAAGLCANRFACTLVVVAIGRWYSRSGVRIQLGRFDWEIIRSIMPSSLTFALSNVNAALQIQATTMAIGLTLGSAAIVMFTTLRTISRVPTQLAGLISAALWPEMTTALGSNRLVVARALAGVAFRYSLWVIIASFVLIVPAGPKFVQIWTHRNVHLSSALIAFYMLAMSVNQINGVGFTILAAVNRQRVLAVAQTIVYAAIAGTIWVVARKLEVLGIVAISVLGEIAIFALLPRQLGQLLKLDRSGLYSLAFSPLPSTAIE